MITYTLPAVVRGLIFDMDLTLYRNEEYYSSQIRNQVVLLASDLGMTVDALDARLASWEQKFRHENEGRKPSFGNTLLGALGYPIEKSVELRRRAIRPEEYLSADEKLQETLGVLSSRCRLVLVTNNPGDIAERTLAVLGVRQFFPTIIGLDKAGHSKPHPSAFNLAYEALGLEPKDVVAVGDRFAVDLETPLARGSGGVLAESMDDIYALPSVLGFLKS